MINIVIDTNVIIAALRSRLGASFRLVELIGKGKFETFLSVPLALEYEAVSKRMLPELTALQDEDIDTLINYVCKVSQRMEIFFLWRPFLRDEKDDMVLELAIRSNCEFIVTHNLKDFGGVGRFGIEAITPKEFLKTIGELP